MSDQRRSTRPDERPPAITPPASPPARRDHSSGGTATSDGVLLTLALPDQLLEQIAQRAAALALSRLDTEREPVSPWLDAKGAIAYLGFTRDRLYKLTAAGAIPHHKRRGGQRLLFHRAELDRWVEQSYAREGGD